MVSKLVTFCVNPKQWLGSVQFHGLDLTLTNSTQVLTGSHSLPYTYRSFTLEAVRLTPQGIMDLQTPSSNNGENANPDPKPVEPSNPNNGETLLATVPPLTSVPLRALAADPSPAFTIALQASPLHFAITAASSSSYQHTTSSSSVALGYEFEFSARFRSSGSGRSCSMSSADELILNGQIWPMKLSTHLERPQVLAPLLDLEAEEEEEEVDEEEVEIVVRGRDLRLRDKSVRRRTRSMSSLRSNTPLEWAENEEDHGDRNQMNNNNGSSEIEEENQRGKMMDDGLGLARAAPLVSGSASSSRSSSAGRSSKRWVFLKDFLRSKSEGRSNNKFWSTISFSPTVEQRATTTMVSKAATENRNPGHPTVPSKTREEDELSSSDDGDDH